MLRAATGVDLDAVLALAVAEEDAWFGSAENSAEELGEWLHDEGGVAAFERHGLGYARSSFSLARPADAPPLPAPRWPDGIHDASYSLGDDDEAFHALIYRNAAWASVPGHTYGNLDAWREALQLQNPRHPRRWAPAPIGGGRPCPRHQKREEAQGGPGWSRSRTRCLSITTRMHFSRICLEKCIQVEAGGDPVRTGHPVRTRHRRRSSTTRAHGNPTQPPERQGRPGRVRSGQASAR